MAALKKYVPHANMLFMLGLIVAIVAGILNNVFVAYNATISLLMVLISLVFGIVHWDTKDTSSILNSLYGLMLLAILHPLAAVSGGQAFDILPGVPLRYVFYFIGSLASPAVLLLLLRRFLKLAGR